MADVIFTPVFRDTKYLHHVCSECRHQISLDQSIWGGVYFGETKNIKFCPHCGNPVIRFSDKPIFETAIDYEPLWPFYELHNEYEDKCKWFYHCYISDERREKIQDLLPFAQDQSGWVKIAHDAVEVGKYSKLNASQKRKLIARFGSEKEGR